MRESARPKSKNFLTGAAVGALAGLIVKELDLTAAVSYWGNRSVLVVLASLVGAIAWLTTLRTLVAIATAALATLWLAVAFTPLTHWMARDLPRRDAPAKADAVFVLASGLQEDGELTTDSMSRLLRGLELLGDSWAPALILSEHPRPSPRYRDAASRLMEHLSLTHEIIAVGPVRNTYDEAVAVAELVESRGFEHILVVTSPSHSRRAAAALEAQGVSVTSVPSQQSRFDFENLDDPTHPDDRIRAFGPLLHERIGLAYYRVRGWIT